MKIKSLAVALCFIVAPTFGQTVSCPDINAIKNGHFGPWLPLNNLHDEPASPSQIKLFKKTIKNFTGAAWSSDYSYGFGRCDYDSDIEVSLASNELPLMNRPHSEKWHWDGIVARCFGPSLLDCQFFSG